MKYSILHSETKERFTLGNEITNSYIDWHIDKKISDAFRDYKESYSIKNDINIFNTSYFNVLCDLFSTKNFSLTNFNVSLVMKHFEKYIYSTRLNYYQNEHIFHEPCVTEETLSTNFIEEIISPDSDKSLESISTTTLVPYLSEDDEIGEFVDDYVLTESFYSKCVELATKDSENIEIYQSQISEKNPIILNEFKEFILGFYDYIKEIIPEQYSKFMTYFNILEEDMQFFKHTQINSLSKYKFVIGVTSRKSTGTRGKTDSFIPAGTCYYGEKIFINSEGMSKKHGSVWFKRSIKRVFYHELGHALDYLYFNDVVLKDGIKRERSSHNDEFKNICRKNYAKFRFFKSYLPKKYADYLAYYIIPATSKDKKFVKPISQPTDDFSQHLNSDFIDIFSDVVPSNQAIYQTPIEKKFSSKIEIKDYILDFSRPLSESWAESFSFVYSWIKEGFNEYDKFAIKAGRSNDRALIKMQYDCLIYILENFDWSKLNISYTVYLKRKTHIKKYLKHIKDMPLFLGKKKPKEARRKVYLSYRDLIKNK